MAAILRGLARILAHRALERLLAVADADERRKVAAGGRPGDGDAIDAIAVVARFGAEKPDRSLDVMDLRRKTRLDRLPEVEAGERVAVLHEGHRRLRLGSRTPGSAVHPHDERWRAHACRQIEIERERLAVDCGVGDVLVHAAVLGVQGQRQKKRPSPQQSARIMKCHLGCCDLLLDPDHHGVRADERLDSRLCETASRIHDEQSAPV